MNPLKIKKKIHISDIQWHRVNFPTLKGNNGVKERRNRTKTRPNPSRAITLYAWYFRQVDLSSQGFGQLYPYGLSVFSPHGLSLGLAPLVACGFP
jgi:hypothetical protein